MKSWSGYINYPVSCCGVVVNPGDIVMADEDGIVSVPKGIAVSLVELCRKRVELEEKWFKSVREGKSTIEAVGLRGKVEELGIVFE
jgi:4-hydroxy-4-methyl-2-oxoglutarate aldolase